MVSLPQVRRQAWVVALVGAVLAGFLAFKNVDQFFKSYHLAYLLFFGLTSGSLGFTLLYLLVGGRWGKTGRVVFRSVSLMMPWVALMSLPIFFGLHHIFPWTHEHFWQHGPAMASKKIYFSIPFYLVRAALYFAIWTFMAFKASKMTDEQVSASHQPAQSLGSIGLLIYVLTLSFAAFDWIMSLEAHWASSIFGALIMVGHGVGALCFAIIILTWLTARYGASFAPSEDTAHDLGNLLLAFCILWTYMTLSQYLIIWSGDLPEEIHWYVIRGANGWQWITTALILCQFVLPVSLLLARERKRDLSRLVKVAIFILAVRFLDIFYMVKPEFSPEKVSVHMLDLFAFMAIGGTWLALVCKKLESEVRP